MREQITTGVVGIEVEDREALAALRRVGAEYKRTMEQIDREEASATIDADIRPFQNEVKQAKAELKRLEGEKAEVELGIRKGDLEKLEAQIAVAKKNVKSLDGMVAEVEIEVHGEKEALAAEQRIAQATAKRLAAQQRLKDQNERIEAQRERRARIREQQRLRGIQQEAQRRAGLWAQREREYNADHALALRMENDMERQRVARERELRSLPKITRQYAELARHVERLHETRRKARGDDDAVLMVDLKVAEAMAEMAELKAVLERNDIEIPVKLKPDRGSVSGAALRRWLTREQGSMSQIAAAAGVGMGRKMGDGFADGFNYVRRRKMRGMLADVTGVVGGAAGRGALNVVGWVGRTANAFSQLTVRLGPFTATIRQAIGAMSVFAPILFDIVGAAGAFVGALGSATAGIGALGVAALGGAIPAFLGMGIVIKQVVGEFQNVAKAQKAYDDAMRKGNTDLAKTKMKELKATMGNVSEETVEMIGRWDDVQAAFRKGTTSARGSVWTMIAEGISTADTLMDTFTKRTNGGMNRVEKSTSRWMAALRSAEGEAVLDTLMHNFNKALSPTLNGLGDIIAYLGKMGAAASEHLPGIMRGFRQWSANLLDTADDAGALEERVAGVIETAKVAGRFFMSAARFAKAFFSAGTDSGESLMDAMTGTMDRWTSEINAGGMDDFFEQSVSGLRQFYNFMRPIFASFSRWATLMSPVAEGIFMVSEAVADVVEGFLSLTALRGPITALLTTLGVLWGVSRITKATTAIAGFTRALLGMKAAGTAAAAAASAGTAAQAAAATRAAATAGGARALGIGAGAQLFAATMAGGVGTKAVTNTSKLTGAAARSTSVLRGLSLVTLGMPSVLGGAAIATGLLAVGAYKLANRTRDWEKSTAKADETARKFRDTVKGLPAQTEAVAQARSREVRATKDSEAANKAYNKEVREGVRGSTEFYEKLYAAQEARREENAAMRERKALAATEKASTRSALDLANDEVEMRGRAIDQLDQSAKGLAYLRGEAARTGRTLDEQIDFSIMRESDQKEMRAYIKALEAYDDAQGRVRKAQDLSALSSMNYKRIMAGMAPMAQKTAKAFGEISRLGGKDISRKISLKFENPEKAGKVARQTAASLRNGVPKTVTSRIIADSKSAEEAIARLRRAKITPKKLEILVDGGQRAVNIMEELIGRKIPEKLVPIVEKGGPKTLALLGALSKYKINDKRFAAILNDLASGKIKGVKGLLAALHDKEITITTRHRQVIERTGGKSNPRVPGMQDAQGGYHVAAATGYPGNALERKQLRAAETASLRGVQPFRSGIVREPRYLVGEETNYPEVVISTNPRDRQRNRKFAAMAARKVGLDVIGAATGSGGTYDSSGAFTPANYTPPTFDPATPKKYKKKKARKQGRGGKFKPKGTNSPWAKRVGKLLTDQEYWEREVSYRESAASDAEPDTFLKPDPSGEKIPGTDEPKMVINDDAVTAFQNSLQSVKDAFVQLLAVISGLVQAIPLAITEMNTEVSMREYNIAGLKVARKKNLDLAKATSDEGDKKRYKEEARKFAKEITRQEGLLKDVKGDRRDMREQKVDTGFDLKETTLQANEATKRHAAVAGTAADELNPPGGGGAGSGGGGVSYGEQLANAGSAMADVLRSFGNNFASVGASGTQSAINSAAAAIKEGATAPGGSAAAGAAVADATRTRTASQMTARTVSGGWDSGGATRQRSRYSGGAGTLSPISGGSKEQVVDQSRTVNNYFQEPPKDPLTWTKGVEAEIGALV